MISPHAPLIIKHARAYNLDPKLVAAVVLQESSGDAKAMRPETDFFFRYVWKNRHKLQGHVPPESLVPLEVELLERATSWGLMQLMGQVLRELGYAGHWLHEANNPDMNLRYGCLLLGRKIDQGGSIEAGLLKYNGGGNKDYPKEVLRRITNGSVRVFLGEVR